jgi:tetrahydromethanopterin S-methyltransferase subunit F
MYYLENIKYKSQDKNIKNIEYKFKLYTRNYSR